MSESFYYVCEKEMGRNKLVHVSLHNYIEAVLERIDIEKIKNRSFIFLLIREMICYNICLCSFAKARMHSYVDLCGRTKGSCESFDEIK